jgi:release factor glutamine methyltransferase
VTTAAFERLLAAQRTVGDCYRLIRDRLRQARSATADREARDLVRAVFPLPPPFADWDGWDQWEDPVQVDGIPCKAAMLACVTERRLAGEPVSRIAGHRGFWTLDLMVTPDTLDPRPDTETVVEAARDMILATRAKDAPLRILDLGTGTGAILLALLAEFPDAEGLGVDISEEALLVAQDNAQRTGLAERASFRQGDWSADIAGPFDLIVSNPPYIPSADILTLDPEVRDHDPHLALDGGQDGLACYRRILAEIPALLAPDGFAVLEFGHGQGASVLRLAEAARLALVEFRNDLNGIERCVILNKIETMMVSIQSIE